MPLGLRDVVGNVPVFYGLAIGDDSDTLFGDGVAEEIASVLTHFQTLFVMGAATSRIYRNSHLPLPVIARQLGVQYLLDGSVRRSGDNVRISVSLINGEDGAQVWAGRFDDDLRDVFALQNRIANSVASTIDATIEFVAGRRAIENPTRSLDAYELFLRANAATLTWDRSEMQSAIVAATAALERDPGFARAAVVLAICHAVF